jgi:hypothetical protein
MLAFDESERGPSDALRHQFEMVSRMWRREQEVVRELQDAVIVKNQVASALDRANKPAANEKKPIRESGKA